MPRTHEDSAMILLAVREDTARDPVAAALVAAGYHVETAFPDHLLEARLAQTEWDVLVFDFAVRDLLKQYVDSPHRPIIILLIDKLRPEDTIMALQEFGADDCLEKPVHIGLLVALINSLLRRAAQVVLSHAAPRLGEEDNIWRLSPTNWTIRCPRGHVAKLTRAETDFLIMLGREPGEAVSRDRLIVAMGHNPKAYDPRRLDTFVSRMRTKLTGVFWASLPLRSIHAVGYAFAAPLQLLD